MNQFYYELLHFFYITHLKNCVYQIIQYHNLVYNLQNDKKPEFNNWQWVSPQNVLNNIVNFKKEIYQKVLKEFKLITV